MDVATSTALIAALATVAGGLITKGLELWRNHGKDNARTIHIQVQALERALKALQSENGRMSEMLKSLREENQHLRDEIKKLNKIIQRLEGKSCDMGDPNGS